MELFELAHPEVEIRRVVIADYKSESVAGTDPLNWSLTPAQRHEVRQSACDPSIQKQYDVVLRELTPGEQPALTTDKEHCRVPGTYAQFAFPRISNASRVAGN
jgi:hypothetical protein